MSTSENGTVNGPEIAPAGTGAAPIFDDLREMTGGYRPVAVESEVLSPRVSGTIPAGLSGTLLRIGPNPIGPVDPARHTPLTGDAMIHALKITDGRAQWYRNRWLRTDKITKALGELPTPGPRHGLSDNANAAIIQHAGHTYALGDDGILPTLINPTDLTTIARSDFDATLPAGFTSHPILDPVTGELHAITYHHADPHHIHYHVIGTDGHLTHTVPITTKNTPMIHAFSLTDRHAVIYDLPVTYDPHAAHTGSRLPYTWDENHGARLGLLPRHGTDADILWMDIDPCYIFHTLNAFETGNHLTLDVIRHERAFDTNPTHPTEAAPTLHRYTIDTHAGTVTETTLDHQPQEFPTIDPRHHTTPHRYAFTTQLNPHQPGALAGPAILRHDLHTHTTDTHHHGPDREAGETTFIPRTPTSPEADGYLITTVYKHTTDTTDITITDTHTFTSAPIATIHLPVRIPHGHHTTWIADI